MADFAVTDNRVLAEVAAIISTPASPPTGKADRPSPRWLRLALSRASYDDSTVRIADPDLTGFAHVVATRHGLFGVNRTGCKLIAYGLYFGLTVRGSTIYAFEACADPRSPDPRGRIVRFHVVDDRIAAADVMATGLPNGCHQIDFVQDRLCVVDTYGQRVLRFPPDGGEPDAVHPLGSGDDGEWDRGYAHINSLIARGGDILLMLHNGADKTGRPSEVATLNPDWSVRRRVVLDGFGCHDFALLEDGTLLCCGSSAGELIGSNGLKVKVCDMMTRGLSVDDELILVGGSAFSAREMREEIAGAVFFLDRDYRPLGSVEIPGPPLDIRRIDGRDRSLSDYVR